MKNIIITGANRGIGLELTKLFTKDNIVYALCRSDFPHEVLSENIKVIKLDVTDEKTTEDFVDMLNSEQVAIDLLINNAGTAGRDENRTPIENSSTVDEVFKTNVVGPMILTLRLTSALKRSKQPVMIAISSRMGTHARLNNYNAEQWPYSASKAALSFAVSAFAINEPGIKSISVHPGWVKTRMGGKEADIEAAESASGIKKLYENINTLEPGSLYSYDGELLDW